jgi:hypothetical protein
MKKYNHTYTLGFSIDSDNAGENVTQKELLLGIAKRLADLIEYGEAEEACGLPLETYRNENIDDDRAMTSQGRG